MKQLIKRLIRYCFMIIYVPYCRYTRGIIIKSRVILDLKTKLSDRCVIHAKSVITNTSVGEGTYLGPHCSLSHCEIGKYCSIAHNVEVISATHPTKKFVSIHPAFFSLAKQAGFTYADKQKFTEHVLVSSNPLVSVRIGSDVWIGANVTILGGVIIGDGAVIATGAVVAKNVEPYSIVGGVPAKHMRYRFDDNQIKFLLDFKWWNKSSEWLKKNVDSFDDIEEFCKIHIKK